MKISKLDLVGYKRMALGAIRSFTIEPTLPTQLILGTNGSGKSSLLRELTPLPPDPADYTKDGSKTISIHHRGHSYLLKSWFMPSQKHSFVKDGEELNPGGTVTVQKELCKKEFGITPEIHELMVGLTNFTTMSPSKRREWFTTLSDVSYDYALQVYNRLKERSRDITGALKMAKKRLVTESEKVISEQEIAKLTQETHQILSELDALQSQRAPVDKPSSHYQSLVDNGLVELQRMSARLLRMRFTAPYGHDTRLVPLRDDWGVLQQPVFTSLESIDEFLGELKQQIGVKQALVSKASEEHQKVKETVDVLIKTGADGLSALLLKKQTLRQSQKQLLDKRKFQLVCPQPETAIHALDSIRENIEAIVSEIPSNEDRSLSQSVLEDKRQTLVELVRAQTAEQSVLRKLQADREHAESHRTQNAMSCPKCSYSWIVGYSDERFAQLLEQLEQAGKNLAETEAKIEQTKSKIAEIERYGGLYRDFVRTTRAVSVLSEFWDLINEENLLVTAPRSIVPMLHSYRSDLELDRQAQQIEKEIDEVHQLIAAAEKIGDANLTESKTRLDQLELEIGELTHQLSQSQQEQKQYQHYRRQLQEAFDLGDKIAQLMKELEQANANNVEMLRRETLNHCVRQLQYALARKEETLSAVSLQKGIVEDLQKQIDSLTVQEEACKQLVKQLSPTDGLIAEGLLGFIRVFTSQMNQIIKKIWSYPLIVKDCGVGAETGAELDYRFPLVVQSKDNVVSDVSKGSSGMQEIVNLAFKITAVKYLDLADSPLFLDEFAARFDTAHKASATELIKNLLLHHPFTQLYMVSHDYGQYGALPNVQVCVICPNNISVPSSYNEHVVLA